jgi:hypothetical protein
MSRKPLIPQMAMVAVLREQCLTLLIKRKYSRSSSSVIKSDDLW